VYIISGSPNFGLKQIPSGRPVHREPGQECCGHQWSDQRQVWTPATPGGHHTSMFDTGLIGHGRGYRLAFL